MFLMGFGKFGFLFIYLCSIIKPQNPQIVIADRCWCSYSGFTSGAVLLVLLLITPNSLFPSTSSIDSLSRLLEGERDVGRRIALLNELGREYLEIDPSVSICYAKNAIRIAEEYGKTSLISNSNIVMGMAYKQLNKLDSAAWSFNSAVHAATVHGGLDDFEDALRNRLVLFRTEAKTFEAISWLDSIGQALSKAKYVQHRMLLDMYATTLLYYTGQIDKSIELCKKNIQIATDYKDYNSWGRWMLYLSSFYYEVGNYSDAMRTIKTAMESKNIDHLDCFDRIRLQSNLSLIYIADKEFSKADDMLKVVMQFHCHDNYDPIECANAYANLAHLDFKRGNHASAISNYKEAILHAEPVSYNNLLALGYYNLGLIHKSISEYSASLAYFEKSLKISRDISDKKIESGSYLGFALHMIRQRMYYDAESMLRKSLSIADEIKSTELQRDVQEAFYKLYKETNDYAKALDSYKRFIHLKDSILSYDKSKELLRIKNQYEIAEKNNQIEIQNLLIAQKAQRINVMALGGGLSISLIGFLFFSIYQRRKRAYLAYRIDLLKLKGYALYTQIGEHFVSNSISRIYTLIRLGQEQDAERYAKKFSDFLKHNIYSIRKDRITLEKELQMLQTYVDLESMKGNEFSFRIEVDDAIDPSKLFIPPLLIQPMVENSIKHGMFAGCNSDTGIAIKIMRVNGSVQICIEDNGQGITHSPRGRNTKGYGLTITQERLKLLHPSNAMVIEPLDRGVRVTLRMNLKAMTDV